MKDWYIEGEEFGVCNCAFGCPCQFEALPTDGHCRGFEALRIDKGHFDGLDLGGLKIAMLYAWPGPIAEGKGELQAIVDENADAAQRAALETVLHGGETDEAATHWWVFRAMSDTVHPTLYKPIEFNADRENVTAAVRVPGVIDSTGEPIRPDHTSDAVHRAQIVIPGGIEFEVAEMGSGSVTTGNEAAIELNLAGKYGQWNQLKHSGRGVVHA
ncbi:MAG TPA: DUF1326 domain-containing protein [Hyphomicrobiaceae bacterium]|jgi:hypothetical protein|nr:DUF1326 domain-containing protein [Hyphomicrobiaceae bacterium]